VKSVHGGRSVEKERIEPRSGGNELEGETARPGEREKERETEGDEKGDTGSGILPERSWDRRCSRSTCPKAFDTRRFGSFLDEFAAGTSSVFAIGLQCWRNETKRGILFL
jgi:hypothetical protein